MANKIENEAPGAINILSSGTRIQGDVITDGDFRIDGTIRGQFISNLKIVIGVSGCVEGDIECRDCEISGKVKGNILVRENLVLRETAMVCGDIRVNRLAIEPGAVFEGHCSMLNVAAENKEA